MTRYLNCVFEMLFVISSLILLKVWVFPFFIYLWFQDMLLTPDWTKIIFGVMTCAIYIGLGSSAKYIYRLSRIRASILFMCLHILLFIPLSFMDDILRGWQGLFIDVFSLFLPQKIVFPFILPMLSLGLFLLGRNIQVHNEKEENAEKKMIVKQKQ